MSDSLSESDENISPVKTRRTRSKILNLKDKNEKNKTEKLKTQNKKSRKRTITESEDESEEEDVSTGEDFQSETEKRATRSSQSDSKKKVRSKKKKGRARFEDESSESEDDDKPRSSKRRKKSLKDRKKRKSAGRKKIRDILKEDELKQETKEAEERERLRLQRLKEKIESSQESVTVADSCTEDDVVLQKEPLVKVSNGISRHLKVHQVEGVKFIWDNLIESTAEASKGTVGNGCILAHCMGLGKTLQTITFLHTILNCKHLALRRVLIVCPLNTVRNWISEINNWTGDLKNNIKTFSLNDCSNVKSRLKALKQWREETGLMVIGYEMFRRLATGQGIAYKPWKVEIQKLLVDPGPDIVVCDEGHMLKNAKASISTEMLKVKTRRRLVLTGTPLQNNLVEYHCMVEFVKPGLLGTLQEFRNRFMNPILNGQHADSTKHDVYLMKRRAHVLHEMLKGFVQRQDYSILVPYLKPKYEYVVKIRLTQLQVKTYRHYLDTMTNKGANDAICNRFGKGTSLFADYQNLMRVWTHPKALFIHSDQQRLLNEKKRSRDCVVEDSETTASETDYEEQTPAKQKNSKPNGVGSNKENKDEEIKEDIKENDKSNRESVDDKGVGSNKEIDDDESDDYITGTSAEEDSWGESSEEESESNEEKKKISPKRSRQLVMESESSSEDSSSSKDKSKGKNPHRLTRSERLQRRKNLPSSPEDSPKPIEPETKAESHWFDDVVPSDPVELERVEHSSKIILLFEILKRAEACGDKTLVFSQSLISLDLIEEFLAACCNLDSDHEDSRLSTNHMPGHGQWFRNIDYFRMDGSTEGHKRQTWINNFNDVEDTRARLFLISTRAGSLGVNLVGANRVIIFDASWNPSHDTQSMFRVYRFGQLKPCYIYRFIAQGTMEEKIYQRQVTKQSLSFRVVDEQQINRYFTASSLSEMYTFTPSEAKDDDPLPIVPKDFILADLLSEDSTKMLIESYHEHDSLLDHQKGEELTEEERKAAWEEFHQEKNRVTTNIQSNNFTQAGSSNGVHNISAGINLLGSSVLDIDKKIAMMEKIRIQTILQYKQFIVQPKDVLLDQLRKVGVPMDEESLNKIAESSHQQQIQRQLQMQQQIRYLEQKKKELFLQKHQEAMMQQSINNSKVNALLMQSLLKMQGNTYQSDMSRGANAAAKIAAMSQPPVQTQTTISIVPVEESPATTITPELLAQETKKIKEQSLSNSNRPEEPQRKKRSIYDLLKAKAVVDLANSRVDIPDNGNDAGPSHT